MLLPSRFDPPSIDITISQPSTLTRTARGIFEPSDTRSHTVWFPCQHNEFNFPFFSDSPVFLCPYLTNNPLQFHLSKRIRNTLYEPLTLLLRSGVYKQFYLFSFFRRLEYIYIALRVCYYCPARTPLYRSTYFALIDLLFPRLRSSTITSEAPLVPTSTLFREDKSFHDFLPCIARLPPQGPKTFRLYQYSSYFFCYQVYSI